MPLLPRLLPVCVSQPPRSRCCGEHWGACVHRRGSPRGGGHPRQPPRPMLEGPGPRPCQGGAELPPTQTRATDARHAGEHRMAGTARCRRRCAGTMPGTARQVRGASRGSRRRVPRVSPRGPVPSRPLMSPNLARPPPVTRPSGYPVCSPSSGPPLLPWLSRRHHGSRRHSVSAAAAIAGGHRGCASHVRASRAGSRRRGLVCRGLVCALAARRTARGGAA